MSSCCPSVEKPKVSCCPEESSAPKKRFDYLLWGSGSMVVLGYLVVVGEWMSWLPATPLSSFFQDVCNIMNSMWLGLLFAILFVGVLNKVPREMVMAILGTKRGVTGLLRATMAGLVLDLCNHGILLVGMKLYERGASLGQTMAFLIASPWNSFSLTLILFALIGFSKTMLFILLSCVIAILSGLVFEFLVDRRVLVSNPNTTDLPSDINISDEFKKLIRKADFRASSLLSVLKEGIVGSKMVLRWILFGAVLAALLRAVLPPEAFETYLGPTMLGLGLTLIGATVIEVCSEGSAPIAADLINMGGATGNGFAFLMAGASTDYTEIMTLKETTKSWKVALFLPLVTLPQIILLSILLNLGL